MTKLAASPVAATGTPTIAELLELPVLARGLPRVLTGQEQLDRPVRWVHVSEWHNPAGALRDGELVLTTGVGFPGRLDDYPAELADVGASGLVLELGRCYSEVPGQLVTGCRSRGVPLIVLDRGVRFVDVTQEVHAMIMGGQLRALRAAQRVHDTFTALAVRGADAAEVVQAAATTTGRAVVLENLAHQALIVGPAEHALDEVLNLWERRSRATPSPRGQHTGVCGPEGWLVTSVDFRTQRWGRLAMLPGSGGQQEFQGEHTMVLERAAVALILARLSHQRSWERQAHRNALTDLVEQRYGSWRDASRRVEALGVPTRGRRLVVVLVRAEHQPLDALAEQLARELDTAGLRTLVGELEGVGVGVLLAVREPGSWHSAVARISALARSAGPGEVTVSVGAEVSDVTEVPRSAAEAEQVAQAIGPGGGSRDYYTVADVGLPQLLYSLRDDPRVQQFAERQLGPLLDYDDTHGTELLASLRQYLLAAGNKSIAARRGHLSRQAFYQRLRLIEQVLGRDLESGEQRAELHVAVATLDAQRRGRAHAR
jgi:purine catabolism regulator